MILEKGRGMVRASPSVLMSLARLKETALQ
jgi:hypothetical protein